MFRNSVDALMQLLASAGGAGAPPQPSHVTSISSKIRILKNGIKHCSVQVLCGTKTGYHIEAFGEEAEDLHRKASEHPAFESAGQ
ncbi:MAG: hypothetical protein ACREBU_05175 [Nitrososphaera sp.]